MQRRREGETQNTSKVHGSSALVHRHSSSQEAAAKMYLEGSLQSLSGCALCSAVLSVGEACRNKFNVAFAPCFAACEASTLSCTLAHNRGTASISMICWRTSRLAPCQLALTQERGYGWRPLREKSRAFRHLHQRRAHLQRRCRGAAAWRRAVSDEAASARTDGSGPNHRPRGRRSAL